ncbi:hypothetical protein AOC36_07220 [Erysipelothrix larvae]|uniref:HTH lacI-type domain-containing protein n=1 Tax=Erysipelothrix larvae TaxID=1514105 RepID=A0A0X8H0S9_9FIRM|nr:LacI family DNA-binding transcriptional regulator [Erysipelothrix larvae]AMC93779.1 hypothetical protein AOC36_07220 [Erysipelothrix larvae]
MVKIKDIAKRANVSSATVSRILRNDPLLSVRDETREDVKRIADEMGYIKRNKKPDQLCEIGVMQWISRFEEEVDPYYYELRKAIESVLTRKGYKVHLYYKEDMHSVLENYNLGGLACVGKFSIKQAEILKEHVKSIVFVDSNPDGDRFCSVVFDFEKATEKALDYLRSLGHAHIGFIGGREYIGPDKEEYVDKREKTFIEYMSREPGVNMNPDDIYIKDFTAKTGYHSMLEALQKESVPTAFFCESDTIAMGALRAIGEQNKNISIVGFNDIKTAQYFNPPLTTIRLDMRAMSEAAVISLMHSMNNPETINYKISLSTKLIERDSAFKI